MVAAATRRICHPWRLRRLRDVGRVPECSLHLRAVSLAVLFAGDLRRSKDGMVWRKTGMVAWPSSVLAGVDHSAVSGTVPVHVLLLSRGVLQGVLGGSAELRRR